MTIRTAERQQGTTVQPEHTVTDCISWKEIINDQFRSKPCYSNQILCKCGLGLGLGLSFMSCTHYVAGRQKKFHVKNYCKLDTVLILLSWYHYRGEQHYIHTNFQNISPVTIFRFPCHHFSVPLSPRETDDKGICMPAHYHIIWSFRSFWTILNHFDHFLLF